MSSTDETPPPQAMAEPTPIELLPEPLPDTPSADLSSSEMRSLTAAGEQVETKGSETE